MSCAFVPETAMRRREFISLIGSVAATWPLAVRAQPAMPVVGLIRSTAAATSMHLVAAFRKGLAEAGFVEGRDVAIELCFADDDLGECDFVPPEKQSVRASY
jgi:hypothetical protein